MLKCDNGCVNWTTIITLISPDWFLSSQLIAERYCWPTIAESGSATWHFSLHEKNRKATVQKYSNCENKDVEESSNAKLKWSTWSKTWHISFHEKNIQNEKWKVKCTAKLKVISRKEPNFQFSGTRISMVSQFCVKF